MFSNSNDNKEQVLSSFLHAVESENSMRQYNDMEKAVDNGFTYGEKQDTLLHVAMRETKNPAKLNTIFRNTLFNVCLSMGMVRRNYLSPSFLLSQKNTDGKTPLHVCVENITPENSSVIANMLDFIIKCQDQYIKQLPFIQDNNNKNVFAYAFESPCMELETKQKILNTLHAGNYMNDETYFNINQQIIQQHTEMMNRSQRKRNFNDGNSSSFQEISPINMPSAKRSRNMGNPGNFF